MVEGENHSLKLSLNFHICAPACIPPCRTKCKTKEFLLFMCLCVFTCTMCVQVPMECKSASASLELE